VARGCPSPDAFQPPREHPAPLPTYLSAKPRIQVLPAAPHHLSVNGEKPSGCRSPLGHPIHDGALHLGHVSPAAAAVQDDFLAYYHAVRCLAANPDAAALFLEALDAETLAILGRAAIRRMS